MEQKGIDIAEREMTRNPIFLLQRRRVIITDDNAYDYENEPPTDDELLENGWGHAVWITEMVFAFRDEAESYGERNAHNFGRKGTDWRVYCIPCNGILTLIPAATALDKESEHSTSLRLTNEAIAVIKKHFDLCDFSEYTCDLCTMTCRRVWRDKEYGTYQCDSCALESTMIAELNAAPHRGEESP